MDTENKTVGLEVKVPDCLNKAAENLTNPITKSVGQTITDIWDIVFGGIGELAERKRILHASKIEQFKSELEGSIRQIPPEKLVMPDTQVVAGALDDARFCVEQDELRNMFKNLIDASLNSDTAEDVHPSFSNIIRRMSPFDAQMLLQFKQNTRKPIMHFVFEMKAGGTIPFQKNVISTECDPKILKKESQSLEVLQSLGLIVIDFSRHLVDNTGYDLILTNPLYSSIKNNAMKLLETNTDARSVNYMKGIVSLSDLGSQFLKVCL